MGDRAIWPEFPRFPPRRSRPESRRRRQRRRRNRASGRVSRPSSVPRSVDLAAAGGETQACAKQSNQVPPWGRRLSCVPGGSFHPGATQTSAGEIIGRRCCFGGLAFVISPPASTSRADECNVGEEIERSATPTAAPSRFSPADVADQAEQTDARKKSSRSCRNCGVAIVILPPELTTQDDRTRRGPNICTKRQFGGAARVIFSSEVTT